MKINLETKNTDIKKYIQLGNFLTIEKLEANNDKNLERFIDVIVAEDNDGNTILLNKDFSCYSILNEDFLTKHKLIECSNFEGDLIDLREKDIQSGDIIVFEVLGEDEYKEVEFLYIRNTYDTCDEAYLIILDNMFVYPASDYLIPYEYESNRELILKMADELDYRLVKTIPYEELELRTI